jgi:phosphoenolpyruvate carboxylase
VFYSTSGDMVHYYRNVFNGESIENALIKGSGQAEIVMVILLSTDITLNVAERLRTAILKCYYIEIRNLKGS